MVRLQSPLISLGLHTHYNTGHYHIDVLLSQQRFPPPLSLSLLLCAGCTVTWPTAPTWWPWRWSATGPTAWWTSSSSGCTSTTSTTARSRAGSSGTRPTASWGPSSRCPSWSRSSWPPWWCGGANAARGSCSEQSDAGWGGGDDLQWPKDVVMFG